MATSSPTGPLGPEDLAELERLLEAVPAPLEPLDVMMLDGFLCGVLLQPGQVPPARWLPHVTDIDQARPLPRSYPAQALHDLVARRFAELNRAIEQRQWFDPWVLEPDEDDAGPLETVMPWVAGFAAAVDLLPSVLQTADERVLEGQALLYRAFDPEDLEDADALLAVMAELEPPEDLDEVVEDMVTAVFLLADVTRPQPAGALAEPAPAVARPAPARPVEATRPAAPQRPAPVAPAAPARSGGASRPAAGGAVPGRPGGQRAPQRPGQPSAARPTGGFGSAWGSGKPAGASPGKTGGATSGKAGASAAGKPAGAGKPAARPAGPAGAGGARGPGKPGFKKPQGGGR